MKWPSSFTLIRHAESAYNELKEKKEQMPGWKEFKKAFNKGYNQKNFEELVVLGRWPDPELVAITRQIYLDIGKVFGNFNDFNTPLTDRGWNQSRATGESLQASGQPPPDVIYVSPYLRTRQTLEGITEAWRELEDVKTVEDERIIEQEHGQQILFYDWRIFSVLNPAEAALQKKIGEYAYRFPGGESVRNVRSRTREFVGMMIREHQDQNVLAVTHHLTILSTRANLERWSEQQFIKADEHEKPKNCGVSVYRGNRDLGSNGRLILEEYNKVHYPVEQAS